MRILVHETYEATAKVMTRFLFDMGYGEVVHRKGTEEAVAALREAASEEPFDAVVVDMCHPDHLLLAEAAARLDPRPTILATRVADDLPRMIRLRRLGAVGFVPKPFDRATITLHFANALPGKGAEMAVLALDPEKRMKAFDALVRGTGFTDRGIGAIVGFEAPEGADPGETVPFGR